MKIKVTLAIILVELGIFAGLILRLCLIKNQSPEFFMGGIVNSSLIENQDELTIKAINVDKSQKEEAESEWKGYSQEDILRFFRPSRVNAKKNKYTYSQFEDGMNETFLEPMDPIYAFFFILEEASNLENTSLGCGTVGNSTGPYAIAYDLLTPLAKQFVGKDQFKNSFEGIGHITFLQCEEAYLSEGTPENEKKYIIEMECIRGVSNKGKNVMGVGLFNYYYGILSVERQDDGGWLLSGIQYTPENWLCAPYHHWAWDADAVTQIAMQDYNFTIESSKYQSPLTTVIGNGDTGKLKFVFLRISNGYDILIHQYKYESKKWIEGNFLDEKWQSLFFH